MNQPSLIQSYLLADRLIDRQQMTEVSRFARRRGTTFTGALVLTGAVDQEHLADFLARRLGLPRAAPHELFSPQRAALEQLDAAFSVRHRVLALRIEGGELIMAMSDPSDSDLVEVVEEKTSMTVARVVALEGVLDEALQRHFGASSQFDPQPASGELRALFARHDGDTPAPIPLVQPKSRPAPRGSAVTAMEDHVTAPLPKLDVVGLPPFAPPPLPTDLDDEPDVPDVPDVPDEPDVLEEPPPLPDDALEGAPTTLHSPRTMDASGGVGGGTTAQFTPATKTQPLPDASTKPPATGTKTQPLPAPPAEERAASELVAIPTMPDPPQGRVEGPSEGALLDDALSWLEALAARRLLLRLEHAQLRGWAGAGFGPAIDVRAIVVDAEPASVFGRTLGMGRIFIGPLGFSRAERRFAMMVGKHAREMLLAPVAGPDGAIALVYCDELRGAMPREEVERFTTQLAIDVAQLR